LGIPGADEQVVEAVAIDVAGRGNRKAAGVVRGRADDLEAVLAVEIGKFKNCRIL
jgi:hypothetical protein